jgi:hypothetical protein
VQTAQPDTTATTALLIGRRSARPDFTAIREQLRLMNKAENVQPGSIVWKEPNFQLLAQTVSIPYQEQRPSSTALIAGLDITVSGT